MYRSTLPVLVSLLLCCMSAPAAAQTGPTLLLRPWEENRNLELGVDTTIVGKATVRSSGDPFRLRMYDAQARWRPAGSETPGPSLGFDLTYLDVTDGRLVDHSLGVGMPITEWRGWQIAAAAGIGYAGNAPFNDSRAIYGMGDLIFSRQLDERSQLQLMLNYDGNRTLFPDVPLPGISYSRVSSEQLRYSVGFPYSSITWSPIDRLTLDLEYLLPVTVNMAANYELVQGLSVFGQFLSRTNAFVIESDIDNRRRFFRQRRIEAGVRVVPVPEVAVTLAAGYAFDQVFRRGFDLRDTTNQAHISDEPYLRFAIDLTF